MFIDEKTNEVSLRSDLFQGLANDADAIINAVIRNMERNGIEKGEVGIKIKIETHPYSVPDPDGVHMNRTREVVVPSFHHEVTSVFKEKIERSGADCWRASTN